MSAGFALALVGVLIVANGLFVAAEFALVASPRGPIEERAAAGDRRARIVLHELQQLSFVLSVAQFGITATSLLVGFLAEGAVGDTIVRPVLSAFGMPEGSGRALSITLAFLLSTVVQMLLGELAPKNLAIARPMAVALAVTPFTRLFGLAFGPVIRLFDDAAAWVTRRMFGVESGEEHLAGHSPEELARIIAVSGESGHLSPHQVDLLSRAVALGDRRVNEVMIPRPDVVWLSASDPLTTLRESARRTGFSRFPVHGEDIDDVVGSVHLKDLLRIDPARASDMRIGDLVTSVHVVPETETLRRLLAGLRNAKRTFTIVVDEYGSTVGIVTLEDVVEQLVGDIEDEFDRPAATGIHRVGRGRVIVPGTTRIEPFTRATGIVLDEGEYETVAGFLLDRLGRIPEPGDAVDVGGARLVVRRMDDIRIAEIEVLQPEVPQ
jgi:CBS domain containing-hemolysin-like protein